MNDEPVGSLDRIRVDAGICGGRPHIRRTRVRVSDILDMLASGVRQSDILADYPYLTEADLQAALAFRAAAKPGGTSTKERTFSGPRQAV